VTETNLEDQDGNGGGPATNEHRPHRLDTHPDEGGSSSTVSRAEPRETPDAPSAPDPRFEFARWVLAEKAIWRRVMVPFVLFLVAAVVIAAVLAPHIGTLGGGIVGAAGAGAVVTGVVKGRRAWREKHEPPPPDGE
jgi:hypothetical protein